MEKSAMSRSFLTQLSKKEYGFFLISSTKLLAVHAHKNLHCNVPMRIRAQKVFSRDVIWNQVWINRMQLHIPSCNQEG